MSRPPAIFVTGPPGVGKSTMAKALARQLRAALLDLDTLTNPLVDQIAGVADYTNLPEAVREARYRCLVEAALDCLRAGCPAVIVGPFTQERMDPSRWARLANQVRAAGGQAQLVWLWATPALVKARLGRRGATRDAAKHHTTPDLTAPVVAHLSVDAALPVEEQVRAVLRTWDETLPCSDRSR